MGLEQKLGLWGHGTAVGLRETGVGQSRRWGCEGMDKHHC